MRTRLLALALVTAISMGFLAMRAGPTPVSAHSPHPGLNFYIAVDGVPNCTTKTADATCDLATGATFVLDSFLDPLPSDIPEYGGFDISLRHSGVTVNHDANTDAWPDCGFPAAGYDDPPTTDVIVFACAVGVPPATASTYSGLLGTISFVCDQSGSLTMLHGQNKTDLVELENIGLIHAEDPNTSETLTINCVAGGVTPVPTTPRAASTSPAQATPLPPTEAARATASAVAKATAAKTPAGGSSGGGGGGLSGGVIAIIVVAVVVVAGGGGFFGWRYYQGRRGGGAA